MRWRSERAFGTMNGVLQLSLLASEPTASLDPSAEPLPRRELTGGAWVDVVPGWVRGADALYQDVLDAGPWRSHQRVMWDKLLDEPRLSTGGWTDPPAPIPDLARALTERYGLDLGAVSANWYRDGQDSVAWHGDTAGRRRDTTIVAILSLGSPRRFLLRPKGGGRSIALTPAHGDLVVLGGTCQRTWDHSVPKMAHAGSRISVMFREPGVF